MELKLFNGWKDRGDLILPWAALHMVDKQDGWKYNDGQYVMAFYKGDPETTNHWVIVTRDGMFYKVGANFMLWMQDGATASWTHEHLLVQLKAAMRGEEIPRDPNYRS